MDVTARGRVDDEVGWFLDYADLDRAFEPLLVRLDHYYLNEIEGLENPTSEVLAAWIWERLAANVPGLWRITVRETCTTACAYYGPGDLPGREVR